MIDTGANTSLISPHAVHELKLRTLERPGVTLVYGNETQTECNKLVRVSGLLGKQGFADFQRSFLVAPLPNGIDMFLGMDFVKELKLTLIPHLGTISNQHGHSLVYEANLVAERNYVNALFARNRQLREHKPQDQLPDKLPPTKLIEADEMADLLHRASQRQPTAHDRSAMWLIHIRPAKLPPEPPPKPSLEDQLAALDTDDGVKDILRRHPSVFPDDLPREPPPERDLFHTIPVKDDHQPFSRSPYRMSAAETEALRKQVDDLLADGKIRPSSSSYGAPALFVRKADGSLRLCIDYRRLNSDTIKDKYPLPHMHDMLDRLAKAKFFTVMDLRSGFWQVPLSPDDTHRTAFTTPFGLYEWVVMPFGLTSAPATFQRLVNTCLADCASFVQAYLDDFIVYSDTYEEHLQQLDTVLQRLAKHKLYVKLSKCQFAKPEVEYVGHVVGHGQVRIHPDKINAVLGIRAPNNKHDVQVLLGLVNWIRRFLPKLAHIATPITDLLKKDCVFEWGEEQQQALDDIKTLVTTRPVLALPIPDKPFLIQTDASDYALGGALLQQDDDGEYHTISYESKRFNSAQSNYTVRDKELLAIVQCLKTWRHLLLGAEFDVQTDHRTLVHLQTQANVNQRHARWLELLGEYGSLSISHIEGPRNGLADALSRLPSDHLTPANSVDIHHVAASCSFDSAAQPDQSQLDGVLSVRALTAVNIMPDQSLLDEIRQGYTNDEHCNSKLDVDDHRYRTVNGLIYFSPDGDHDQSSRLLIPADDALRVKLLREAHEPRYLAHRGKHSTYFALHKHCYWRAMLRDVADFVRSCSTCLRNRPAPRKATGAPTPLPIPPYNWHTVTMDFAVNLPTSANGNDAVLVVVDKLSKRKHLIPCRTDNTAEDVAAIYYNSVFRHHGVPVYIVSDRDPKFTSDFWQSLAKQFGTTLKMSTSSHPQSDGQSENAVRQLKESLRSYLCYDQDDWEDLLPSIEFALNSTPSASTGYTPFELDTGYLPSGPLAATLKDDSTTPAALQAQEFVDLIRANVADARDNLAVTQDRQAARQELKSQPNPYAVGDKVFVHRDRLKDLSQTRRPSRKLRQLYCGPFVITDLVGDNAARLDLPKEFGRAHATINVEFLKRHFDNPDRFQSRVQPPPPPLLIDGEENFIIEKLLDHKTTRNRRSYLVQWQGYDDPTWEPFSSVEHCAGLLQEYHAKHPL